MTTYSRVLRRIPTQIAGLRLTPADWGGALRVSAGAAVALAMAIVLLDSMIYRDQLSDWYVAGRTGPVVALTYYMMKLAVWEELVYRGLVMTALVACLSWGKSKPAPGVMIFAIVASQFANVATAVLPDPLYGTLRFWAPGCVWGWLYWRHGLLSAMFGHALCHVLLDPLLRWAL